MLTIFFGESSVTLIGAYRRAWRRIWGNRLRRRFWLFPFSFNFFALFCDNLFLIVCIWITDFPWFIRLRRGIIRRWNSWWLWLLSGLWSFNLFDVFGFHWNIFWTLLCFKLNIRLFRVIFTSFQVWFLLVRRRSWRWTWTDSSFFV